MICISSYVLIKTPPSFQGSEWRYSHPIGSPGKHIRLSGFLLGGPALLKQISDPDSLAVDQLRPLAFREGGDIFYGVDPFQIRFHGELLSGWG